MKKKNCQILKDVGQGNFTLSYVKNDKNFQDKYTKDYISYGYWNDGIALINPNNTREKLYRLGFTENGVEVLSSLMDVETNSVIEYSGIDYFIESDDELVGNEFDPSDIKKSDTLGYYIDNLESVMVLSGILSHAEMTYMDSILLKLNDDGSLTFAPALLNNDRSEATHIFDEATFIDIGSTIDEKVDSF